LAEAVSGPADPNPSDPAGCLLAVLRLGCSSVVLWGTMLLAIIAVAIISLLVFR
jgi:hypothetical protein